VNPTDDFLALLRAAAGRRRRLPLNEISRTFLQWRPEMASDGRKRETLAAALTDLAQGGCVELPKGKEGYDRAAQPPLPAWILLLAAAAPTCPAPFDHRAIPWVPQLAFVAGLPQLPNPEVAKAINEFFRQGGAQRPMVPVKERSYAIFGDEKRLEDVLKSRTFGPGLSHAVLRCYEVGQIPVHRTEVRARLPDALILENEAAFDSFARWNRTAGRFRWIVYGRGNDVLKSPGFLRELQQDGGVSYYFGDLDAQGIWLPFELSRKLVALGAGPARPLAGAYRRLASAPSQRQDPPEAANGAWRRAVEWLPAAIRFEVTDLLARGARVPQEALGWESLAGIAPSELVQ
jgi:hypothetical protein